MDEKTMYGPPVKDGEEFNLKIEALGKKGDGIAKIERYTIFVPGATKVGETVKVKIKRALPKFAFADIIEDTETKKDTEPEDTEDFGNEEKK